MNEEFDQVDPKQQEIIDLEEDIVMAMDTLQQIDDKDAAIRTLKEALAVISDFFDSNG